MKTIYKFTFSSVLLAILFMLTPFSIEAYTEASKPLVFNYTKLTETVLSRFSLKLSLVPMKIDDKYLIINRNGYSPIFELAGVGNNLLVYPELKLNLILDSFLSQKGEIKLLNKPTNAKYINKRLTISGYINRDKFIINPNKTSLEFKDLIPSDYIVSLIQSENTNQSTFLFNDFYFQVNNSENINQVDITFYIHQINSDNYESAFEGVLLGEQYPKNLNCSDLINQCIFSKEVLIKKEVYKHAEFPTKLYYIHPDKDFPYSTINSSVSLQYSIE